MIFENLAILIGLNNSAVYRLLRQDPLALGEIDHHTTDGTKINAIAQVLQLLADRAPLAPGEQAMALLPVDRIGRGEQIDALRHGLRLFIEADVVECLSDLGRQIA
jgi:hypothetical protein